MLRRPRTKTVPAAQRRLAALLTEIRACTVCAPHLEHGPRPVLRAHSAARILIVGQAPGIRVHRSGIPWDDPSGDRLRQWLDVDRDTFYDETRIAIVPSGFCYPGTSPRGGDYPPRPECAPRWMDRVVALLPHIQVTLLAGRYAQRIHLGARQQANRDRARVARLLARLCAAAAPQLSQQHVDPAQPVVRGRGVAGPARARARPAGRLAGPGKTRTWPAAGLMATGCRQAARVWGMQVCCVAC